MHLMEPFVLCLLEKDVPSSTGRRVRGTDANTADFQNAHHGEWGSVPGRLPQWHTRRLWLGLGAHSSGPAHSSRQSISAPESFQSNNSGNTRKLESKNYKTGKRKDCQHLCTFLPLFLLLRVLKCYVPTTTPGCCHQSLLRQMWLLEKGLKKERALKTSPLGVTCVK